MILGCNAHVPAKDKLDLVKRLRMPIARWDLNWPDVERTRGELDWSLCNMVVEAAQEVGVSLYPTISQTPGWANHNRGKQYPPENPDDLQEFAYQCARKYPHITHWSAWNEPNAHLSVDEYLFMILEPIAKGVRLAGEHHQVCGPELMTEGQWWPWLEKVLKDGWKWIDVVTVHCYQRTGREVLRVVDGPNRLQLWPLRIIPSVVDVMQRVGMSHKSYALTEVGWDTLKVSEEVQAKHIDELLEAAQRSPMLALLLFQLIDEADTHGNVKVGFGLWKHDFSPKLAVAKILQRTTMQIREV